MPDGRGTRGLGGNRHSSTVCAFLKGLYVIAAACGKLSTAVTKVFKNNITFDGGTPYMGVFIG